jgi:hypothetical protein
VSDVAHGPLVLSAYRYSFDIWYIALPYTKLQIKVQFGFDPLIFPKVMALEHKNSLR